MIDKNCLDISCNLKIVYISTINMSAQILNMPVHVGTMSGNRTLWDNSFILLYGDKRIRLSKIFTIPLAALHVRVIRFIKIYSLNFPNPFHHQNRQNKLSMNQQY